MALIKHHEFWNPRLFETPYYFNLVMQCLKYRLYPRDLLKANYALDHGELGIGSKYQTQMAFDQKRFLATELIPDGLAAMDVEQQITKFAAKTGYPLILKPDIGCVGKGILRIDGEKDAKIHSSRLSGATLLQEYTPHNTEYGVFYVRYGGKAQITGINAKLFPTIVGDGTRSIDELARNHHRYSHHWRLFLQYHQLDHILEAGEELQLSFIGSHTMGCQFSDTSELTTPALEAAVCEIFENQPGFNFGRLDIKAASREAAQDGEFVVIEVNGIPSLPTHMFDPKYSLRKSYRILFEHGRHLALAAGEHKHMQMSVLPYLEIIKRVRQSHRQLTRMHENALTAS